MKNTCRTDPCLSSRFLPIQSGHALPSLNGWVQLILLASSPLFSWLPMVLSLRRMRCILQIGAAAANLGALMLTVALLSRRHNLLSHSSAHSSRSASDTGNNIPFDHWSSNRATADDVILSNANERMTGASSDIGAQCFRLAAGCGPSECGPHGHCVTYKYDIICQR